MLAKSNTILKLPVQGLDFKVDHRVCQPMEPVHGSTQFGTLPYPIVTNTNWAEILEKHLAMSQYPGFQVCTPKWLVLKMFLKLYIYILYIYRRTSSMFIPSWKPWKNWRHGRPRLLFVDVDPLQDGFDPKLRGVKGPGGQPTAHLRHGERNGGWDGHDLRHST
jgi:hypothetical protein